MIFVMGKSFPVSIQVTFSRGSVKSVGLGVHTAPNTGFTYRTMRDHGEFIDFNYTNLTFEVPRF